MTSSCGRVAHQAALKQAARAAAEAKGAQLAEAAARREAVAREASGIRTSM